MVGSTALMTQRQPQLHLHKAYQAQNTIIDSHSVARLWKSINSIVYSIQVIQVTFIQLISLETNMIQLYIQSLLIVQTK